MPLFVKSTNVTGRLAKAISSSHLWQLVLSSFRVESNFTSSEISNARVPKGFSRHGRGYLAPPFTASELVEVRKVAQNRMREEAQERLEGV